MRQETIALQLILGGDFVNGLTQHEVWDLQEHIRGEAATAHTCRQFAQMAADPDIRRMCEQEARIAETNVQRLMALLQEGTAH